jgi:type IV pilus assembly protein PilW
MNSGPIPSRGTPRAERGMSLVEILVATAVGLIGVTMIMQVFAVAEGQKRTATGGSDAQVSGNIALFNIERDLRHAGFGMVTNGANMLGCNTLAHDRLRPGGSQDFSFTMAPVIITENAAGNSDTVKVAYGNSFNVVDSSPFSAGAASDANFPLKNAAGLQVGGLVVPFEGGKDCVLAEITAFSAGAVNTVEHTNGAAYTYNDTSGNPVNVTERYNKSGGLGAITYTSGTKLFSLGRDPVVKTYAVVGDKLMTQAQVPYVAAQDTMNAAGVAGTDGLSDAEVATGIVQLKAVYGKDVTVDPGRTVDTWNTTLPANATEWLQVRALRVAILARSGLFEKTPVYTPAGCVGTACTPPAPAWMHPSGGTTYFTMSNLADGTDWRNYRYRVYQTTVPLRNMIWSNDP